MNKKKYFFWSTLILLLTRFFPILNFVIDFPEMLIFVIYASTNLVLFYKSFQTKATVWFFIFFSIVSLLILVKGFNYYWFFVPLQDIFVCYIVWIIISRFDYYNELKKLTGLSLLFITITALTTIPFLIINSHILRDPISENSEKSMGLISYSILHGMPSLIPIFVYKIKNSRGKQMFLWLFLLVIISYLIFISNFGTILFISLIIIPVSFLISTKRFKITIILLVISLLVLTNDSIILYTIDTLSPFYADTAIENKLIDIKASIKYGSQIGEVGGRGELYKQSFESFISNPIIGTTEYEKAGGHAYIIDFMAWFGLLGTIPLIIFYILFIKEIMARLKSKQKRMFFSISFSVYIVLAFTKGTPHFEQLFITTIITYGILMSNDNLKQIYNATKLK